MSKVVIKVRRVHIESYLQDCEQLSGYKYYKLDTYYKSHNSIFINVYTNVGLSIGLGFYVSFLEMKTYIRDYQIKQILI